MESLLLPRQTRDSAGQVNPSTSFTVSLSNCSGQAIDLPVRKILLDKAYLLSYTQITPVCRQTDLSIYSKTLVCSYKLEFTD